MDEILYFDGWADGAVQLGNAIEEHVVYRITGARSIKDMVRFSAPQYYLRFRAEPGIQAYEESASNRIPFSHHMIDGGPRELVEQCADA